MQDQDRPDDDTPRLAPGAPESKAVDGVMNKAIWPVEDKAVHSADDKGASS